MPLSKYTCTSPIDHTIVPDTTQVKGESVIITGDANGMGVVMVRTFVKAGAFVTFADVNTRGKEIEREVGSSICAFVKCDLRNWEEQIRVLEAARASSAGNSADVVITNAGISEDEV